MDSVARGQVAVWHWVERRITETLELQQMMFRHHRWKHGLPGSSWVIDCLECHVHFCSVSLIEYHQGPTAFDGTGSLSKNNTCHLEIIKTRSDVTDSPSSPKEKTFFKIFFTGGETPSIPVNLLTKLLVLI